MNTPLQFNMEDKKIYQMGLNAAPTNSSNFKQENSTAVLTNQLLEILNPPLNGEDKTKIFNDLMAPHYNKQNQIIDRIEQLTTVLTDFIKTQQSINDSIFERLPKSSITTPQTYEQSSFHSINGDLLNLDSKSKLNDSCDIEEVLTSRQENLENELLIEDKNKASTSDQSIGSTEMSVRDFLKNNLTNVMKKEDEMIERNDDDDKDSMDYDEALVKYNKFRVRNPPKKYKRNSSTFGSGSQSDLQENIISLQSTSGFNPLIAIPSPQRLQVDQPVDMSFLHQHIYSSQVPTSFSISQNQHQSSQIMAPLVTRELRINRDENIWKNNQLITEQIQNEHDFRQIGDNSHGFLPYPGTVEPHSRSAFVPATNLHHVRHQC